jgi:putative acetyltransferase
LNDCGDDLLKVTIRAERPGDAKGIRAVHVAAFGREAEANLVDQLRQDNLATASIVAEEEGAIVGHILFSPVTIECEGRLNGRCNALGLGPMAVLPDCQRRGIGSDLIKTGLAACRDGGVDFVVVRGHPAYYPRFGFRRAHDFNLDNEYGADEAFMAIELHSGGLPTGGGLVRYALPFRDVD